MSTDFDVHRNWLAITGSLPLSEWYTNQTSEWTLDYPPLFAAFEWILAQIARVFAPSILQLSATPIRSWEALVFQKSSVILADSLLFYALWQYACSTSLSRQQFMRSFQWSYLLLYLHPGLLLLDHVHFQYNGFLTGFLVLSISLAVQRRYLLSLVSFVLLLHCKHIYIYLFPAFGTFFLFSVVLPAPRPLLHALKYFVVACILTLLVWSPFLSLGQGTTVLRRLFPFEGRGLMHAYWAPNFWVVYTLVDKACCLAVPNACGEAMRGALTSGLVGAKDVHSCLPQVTPFTSLGLTLAASLLLVLLVRRKWSLPMQASYAALCAFVFGWHVHEKALLLVLYPLGSWVLISMSHATKVASSAPSITPQQSMLWRRLFIAISLTAHCAIYPLLEDSSLIALKLSLLLWHVLLLFCWWQEQAQEQVQELEQQRLRLDAPWFERLCFHQLWLLTLTIMLLAIGGWEIGLWRIVGGNHLPFLPLMLVSTAMSLPVGWSMLVLIYLTFQ